MTIYRTVWVLKLSEDTSPPRSGMTRCVSVMRRAGNTGRHHEGRRSELTNTWRRTKTIYWHTNEGIRYRWWSEAGKKGQVRGRNGKHWKEGKSQRGSLCQFVLCYSPELSSFDHHLCFTWSWSLLCFAPWFVFVLCFRFLLCILGIFASRLFNSWFLDSQLFVK